VDEPWTGRVDNLVFLWTGARRPQEHLSEGVVTHKIPDVIHIKSSLGAQACAPNLQNRRPQSYPQGVDDENGVRLHLLSPTDSNVTGLCITPWMAPASQTGCYRDWLRIRLVSSVTWL
jgi:hypothetical protein